jgi:hypothetical protein
LEHLRGRNAPRGCIPTDLRISEALVTALHDHSVGTDARHGEHVRRPDAECGFTNDGSNATSMLVVI